jgi:GT2 family glycosyltransferase
MSDEVLRLLAEGEAPAAPDLDFDPLDRAAFDEAAYLRANPDVAASVARGEIDSGYRHFLVHGLREGRPTGRTPHEPRNRVLRSPGLAAAAPVGDVVGSCDALIASPDGSIMVIGWIDDVAAPLSCIRIVGPSWRLVLDGASLIRVRRQDAEGALGRPVAHAYGFIGFVAADQADGLGGGPCGIEFWLANGASTSLRVECRMQTAAALRDTLLATLAHAEFLGNPDVERVASLEGGFGTQVVRLNRAITDRFTAGPFVETFGPPAPSGGFRGTIIVCLYGKAEFLSVQNALYAGLPGIEDYEFVYVSNSPELGEALLRDARIGSRTHGIAQTVMVLGGNAGFGAANNAALRAMRSDRVLIVNPDVFPLDADWAARHTALVEDGPGEQTRLFGVPLFYDDGSLMHGGMHFEMDHALSLVEGEFVRRSAIRVEHYGKGAPPGTARYLRSHPVPAITGAFISADRAWYEKLGGFTEDFVFGHYEDADLCLKSLEAGTAPWLHPLRMWHLEGKGSTRLPAHEGGSAVNRWLFSTRWGAGIEAAGLLGARPTHALLQPPESWAGDGMATEARGGGR